MNTNKKERGVLLCLTALALAIRLLLIFKRAPAADEIWVLLLTRASFKDIWLGTLAERNLPLFYWFLRAFSLVFNLSLGIFGLRLIALFFGILASIGIGYLGFLVLGKRGGMIAFALALFLPASIWAAVFVKYYSFLILLTSLVMMAFTRFLKGRNFRDLVLFTGLSAIGVYTHYYFFLLLLSFGAYLFLTKKSRELIKSWIYCLACVSLLFTPGLFYFLFLPKQQLWMSESFLKIPAIILSSVTSFETLLYIYHQQVFFYPLVFLACLFVLVVALLGLGLKGWKDDLWILFLLVIFFPPSVALLVSFLVKPIFGVNSLLIFLPAFVVILARGIDDDLKRKKVLSFIFLVLIISSQVFFFKSSDWLSTFAKPFKFVESEHEGNDLVLHADIYTFIQAKYFLKREVNFGVIPTTYPAQTEKALGYQIIAQEDVFDHQGRVWYFEPEYFNVGEAKAFKATLDENLVLIKKEKFRQSLTNVYLYSGRLGK